MIINTPLVEWCLVALDDDYKVQIQFSERPCLYADVLYLIGQREASISVVMRTLHPKAM